MKNIQKKLSDIPGKIILKSLQESLTESLNEMIMGNVQDKLAETLKEIIRKHAEESSKIEEIRKSMKKAIAMLKENGEVIMSNTKS